MSTNMHQKVKNFFGFLADSYQQWFSDPENDTLANSIRSMADDKAEYKQFQFGYMAVACNNVRFRPKIEIIRDLFKNPDNMKVVVSNIRGLSAKARVFLDKVDSVPDSDIEEFIIKFSRYINLFTLMYFK